MKSYISMFDRMRQGGGVGFFRRLITPAARKKVCVKQLAESQAEPEVLHARPGQKRVLIIDDDAVILKTASMKLRAKGYAVTTASDGAEAIRLVREAAPDIILLDINFPPDIGGVGWDGFSLLHWLRNFSEGHLIPVVMITANVTPYRNRAAAMGAAAIFSKPLAYDLLANQMQRLLECKLKPGGSDFGVQT